MAPVAKSNSAKPSAKKSVKATAKPSKAKPRPSTEKPGKPAKRPPAAAPSPATKAASKAPARSKVPFPKKNQPPSEAEFLARLPLAAGKKFEGVRAFLRKQKGVVEDLYFYGPKTGWAYRYRHGAHSLATVMLHGDRLVGICALDEAALGEVDFTALSDVGERARRLAHGSPSLSWLDLPLDGPGASDFKVLLKAKLRTLPNADAAMPAAPPSAAATRAAAPPPPPPPPAPSSGARRARSG
jgi:hypothetical protein